ncbi:unnamed protein product [Arabis nemorensis]|uniref:Uncharacterized protein n=1 Tax=Arabis nemorensis TaxID=586526 RepID=A0A565AXE0_9BRAS|nr:unnamed protein product [Arabis nemorensis]
MAIQGFIHGLQLVALSCIPQITSFATSEKNTKRKEIVASEDEYDNEEIEKPLSIGMRLVKDLDADQTVKVTYTLPTENLHGQDLTWSKDQEDGKVNYMIDLLEKNHNFTNASWSGGLDAKLTICQLLTSDRELSGWIDDVTSFANTE